MFHAVGREFIRQAVESEKQRRKEAKAKAKAKARHDELLKAADELYKQLEACEEEAKKPRPAPPPQQYIRGIPIGHASAGMPPDPCADLRKRYDEAKKALEDAVE
jgi:hypothetical protein